MLTIYGVPNSQPVRAVIWLCALKQLPFRLQLASQNRDAKTPDFLTNVNPRGTIPAIDDGGFVLWESHAILVYLCEKHGWEDFWPSAPEPRALVNQYLHFHHRNTRELVVSWSRALWPRVFGVDNPTDEWIGQHTFTGLVSNAQTCATALRVLEHTLGTSSYLATDQAPTLADLSAYQELGQNQSCYANCTDFEPYPHIRRWLAAMRRLAHHDTVHAIWSLIGDVNRFTGGMRAIAAANKEAARRIQTVGEANDA
ncbi:MAG: glutathione S-transferase [Gammaproteobacteria bacterium]|jgi:glutathione S-transferase